MKLPETPVLARVADARANWTLKRADRKFHRPERPRRGRRFMAYLLLTSGTAATIGGNIAHAQDNIGAKLLSAVIPVLLFIAFHVAAADGRWLIRVTTSVVALVCFGISYDHISALAVRYGEGRLSAVLYPLAIDGAMIVATFVLSRPARTEDKPAVAVPKPVRPAVRAPGPVLSSVLSEDKPEHNGFHRPPPPRAAPVPKDNDARLSAAAKIAADLGDSLSRGALVKALREQGYTINTNEAAALTRQLKAARS